MQVLPALTVDGITHPKIGQPVILFADGEVTEFSNLEDTRRHLRCLELNGRYPEILRLFNCVKGGWIEVPI